MENFSHKIDEWEISDDTACRIIDAIVQYAIKNNQLRKGLALLSDDRVLEAGLKSIDISDKTADRLIDRIEHDHTIVISSDPLGKVHNNAISNIIKWYVHGLISITYIASSKKCHDAMMALDKLERSMMPSAKELIIARLELGRNPKVKCRARMAMLDDWRDI